MLVNIQPELDRICIETGTIIKYDEPLGPHTSLKIGGRAMCYLEVRSLNFIERFIKYRADYTPELGAASRLFVLGGGSNILFSDSRYDGYIVCIKGLGEIKELKGQDSDDVLVSAGAGVMLQGLMNYAKDHGYSGLEGMTGIPGTIGGAIYGNAGSYGCDIASLVKSVTVIDSKGQIRDILDNELRFRYRGSNILDGEIILSARIKLRQSSKELVSSEMKSILERKKASQPIDQKSAGCVFKNPQGQSAGRLIEQAGCKELNQGDIAVSQLHANFFINRDKGTCKDFLILMDKVREKVFINFALELEPEIKIISSEIMT